MPTFAMRLTEQLLDFASELAGAPVNAIFEDTPYMVLTMIDPTEYHIKLMSEDEMLEAYKDNAELEILN